VEFVITTSSLIPNCDGLRSFRPSVEIDGSWWDPIGNRGTVSYLVISGDVIPDTDLIGYPGQYIKEGCRPVSYHITRNFLGPRGRLRICPGVHKEQNKVDESVTSTTISGKCRSTLRLDTFVKARAGLWETGIIRKLSLRQPGRHVVSTWRKKQ